LSAISEKSSADKTAILIGRVYRTKDLLSLYILPNIINKRMDYPSAKETLKNLSNTINPKRKSTILVEQVASQAFMLQDLQKAGYPAIGVELHGQDKPARLRIASDFVKNGNVFFPKNCSSELVDQLLNFGVERYDDLADAFSMLVNFVFVSPEGVLSNQVPVFMKCNNLYNLGNLCSRGEDWADREDRQMFQKYRRPNNGWNRIMG
jgi:predicted phage terminase large subunit-like protein